MEITKKDGTKIHLHLEDPENKCLMCGSECLWRYPNNYNKHVRVKCNACNAEYHLNKGKR